MSGKVTKPQAGPKVKETKKQAEKDELVAEDGQNDVNSTSSETDAKEQSDQSVSETESTASSEGEKDVEQAPSQASTTDAIDPQLDSQTAEYQQYYAQYQQAYVQQYQQYIQYYSQYGGAAQPPSASAAASDPTQDPIYAYYAETAAANMPKSFDSRRAARQMASYFDPSKYSSVLSPEMQAARQYDKQQQQARLTAKEIQAFKKRKQELKKKKNQWFYE